MAIKINKFSKEELLALLALLVGLSLFGVNYYQKSLKPVVEISTITAKNAVFNKETGMISKQFVSSSDNKVFIYEMKIPQAWNVVETSNTSTTIQNGDYLLKIEEEYEGFNCNFSESTNSEMPYDVSLNLYKDIKPSWGTIKVGFKKINTEYVKKSQFIFCQKYTYPDNVEKWQGGSKIGLITLDAPLNFQNQLVNDAIEAVTSIRLIDE